MFVFVTLFMPKGIVGIFTSAWTAIRQRRASDTFEKGAGPTPGPATDSVPIERHEHDDAPEGARPSPAE